MVAVADVVELQQALHDLSVLASQDVNKLWQLILDRGLDPVEIRTLLIQACPDLVLPYVSAATQMSAQWYDEQLPDSVYRAVAAPLPEAAELAASASWASGPAFDAAVGIATSVSPADLLSGSLQRRVFNGSRMTVVRNAMREEGATWARYASANACAFCRMLAIRGATYSSKEAATTVVGRGKAMDTTDAAIRAAGGDRRQGGQFAAGGVKMRGSRKGGDRFHDHCRCMAVPVRPGETYKPPPYVEDWQQQYVDATRMVEKGKPLTASEVLANMRKLEGERRSPTNQLAFDVPAPARAADKVADAADEVTEAAADTAVKKPKRAASPFAGQSADELMARFEAKIAADEIDDEFDALDREINRRHDRATAAREKRAADREAKARAQDDEYERLLGDGVDDETAIERAYGVAVPEQRRRNARAHLAGLGYQGRNLDEQVRAWHRDEAYRAYIDADEATNGYLLRSSSEGKIDPAKLWFASEATARKHASEELLAWWDQNGRVTARELEAQLLDPGELARIQSSQRDYLA